MTQNTWGWSDRLNLSYAPMDDIHHEFVELCAALSENNPDTFIQRLDALIAHSIEHFEQENRWMEETAFPPAGCHRQEHEAVLEVMREVRRRVEEEGDNELAARLAEELPHWFEHHVDTMDNMLARFMANLTADSISGDVQEKASA
ncbi:MULTISPECIES: hemerythrin domain-containing protein [unclassified Undibacterium]|jgi:hemerythrin-like metal-binding protein|uniref:hemerythrin domain-containing protein n=1 Tax=unclassified Undibacterium TaxID=2630295 RepID=UPI00164C5E5B|nr:MULTISPECIES: hemerythrin domain-containing protein [unclassified Undibacterium]MBC3878678.1 hemerythrin domain-containing protein [Undibacterium sp. FT79W]MBC3929235.1 hemerythrin domain-containing protein [Undibacterium sp. CY21W]MBK1890473.1 hemerythrin domain-containing protein [Undibacterium sp. 14-3-2]